jgi:RimJ/RimL family protein N-acetyltransferase
LEVEHERLRVRLQIAAIFIAVGLGALAVTLLHRPVALVRGRGYAFEAAGAVVAWVLPQPGVRSVSATVPLDNLPSQHLAAKLGLAYTGETRRDLPLWRPLDREARD